MLGLARTAGDSGGDVTVKFMAVRRVSRVDLHERGAHRREHLCIQRKRLMTAISKKPSPSGQDSSSGGPGKSPEQEPRPQTTPQPQGHSSAQSQHIWRIIAITSFVLGLGASFAIAAIEIFLREPILDHPPVDEISQFSQPFGIRNRMSFFTMHNTCVVWITGSEIFDPQSEFIGKELRDRLGDIGPGKTNSIETPVIRLAGKPLYGSFTFFVRYGIYVFGGHWTRDFYLGTCQWALGGKVMWECPEAANTQIRLLVSLKKALERCN
jgi:hypothetical protein